VTATFVLGQDNEISWVDWDLDKSGKELAEFVRKVIALRQTFPILRRTRFLTEEYNPDLDVKDVTWLTPNAKAMKSEDWQDASVRCFGMLLDGRAQASGIIRIAMVKIKQWDENSHRIFCKRWFFNLNSIFPLPEYRRLVLRKIGSEKN